MQDPFPPGAQPTPAGAAGSPSPSPSSGHTNTNAVLALVFGIISFTFLPLIAAILAVFFASKAEEEIKADPSQEGATFATVGKVLGWINIVLVALAILVMLLIMVVFAGMLGGFR